jgi:hypothetical protein
VVIAPSHGGCCVLIGQDAPEEGFPEVISPEEWEGIAPLSGIPGENVAEARIHVNGFIDHCRETRSDAQTQPHVSKIWKRLKDSADLFSERLDDVLSHPDAFAAIAQGFDGQRKIHQKSLAEAQRHLQEVRKAMPATLHLCDTAIKRVHRTKHGRRTGRESLDMLVRLLNGLLKEFAGKRISRSNNKVGSFQSRDFVWEVCHRAFDKVTRATVDNAIARVVTEELSKIDHVLRLSDELLPSRRKSGKLPIRGKVSKILVAMPMSHVRMSVTKDRVSWRVIDRASAG